MTDEKRFSFFANATWTEGRSGELKSGGLPSLSVSAPPEFQGREGSWTPELLYVGAVASCFMATFAAIAEFSKLDFRGLSIEAEGKLEMVEGSGYEMREIVLRPTLVVSRSRDLDRGARILEKAEKKCFVTNSIKTKVQVEPLVYQQQDPAQPHSSESAGLAAERTRP